MVVSVSRRCDIPRFQFNWFMERLKNGYVDVTNPFNAAQIKRVSLLCENVDAFVFWTRDPAKILENTDELIKMGYHFYVMVSVTGYPNILEPNMIPAYDVIASMKKLAQKIRENHFNLMDKIIWRYDPIILTSVTDIDFHRRNFNELAEKMAGFVRRVIISIYDEYQRASKRLSELEGAGKLQMISIEDADNKNALHNLLAEIAKCAKAKNMEIQSCAEKENFTALGIKPGACIDASLINDFSGMKFSGNDKNQRPNCLCCKSIDIGVYNSCSARCVYCYAS